MSMDIQPKKIGLMMAKLQMMAYQELYNAMMTKKIRSTKMEREYAAGMSLQSQEFYDNYDSFYEQLSNDHAGQALMQSALAPYMDKG